MLLRLSLLVTAVVLLSSCSSGSGDSNGGGVGAAGSGPGGDTSAHGPRDISACQRPDGRFDFQCCQDGGVSSDPSGEDSKACCAGSARVTPADYQTQCECHDTVVGCGAECLGTVQCGHGDYSDACGSCLQSAGCGSQALAQCKNDENCAWYLACVDEWAHKCSEPGGTDCSGTCAYLSSDSQNCGSCGHACKTTELCASGACTCDTSLYTECTQGCVDTKNDALNCGACDAACPGDAPYCWSGQCWCAGGGANGPSCPGIYETGCCGGGVFLGCKLLDSDAQNCGSCGHACSAGQSCLKGKCQ